MDAAAFIELFDFAFDVYALDAKNLCFYVCDHAASYLAILPCLDRTDSRYIELMPTAGEEVEAVTLFAALQNLESAQDFKSGVVKVLHGEETMLTQAETDALAKLKVKQEVFEAVACTPKTFAERILFDDGATTATPSENSDSSESANKSSESANECPVKKRTPASATTMDNILETVVGMASSSGNLSRSPSKARPSGSFAASSKRILENSSRSLATPPPGGSRSGRTTPVQQQLEMSVTEQIARKARKSTVLDDKNALLILAIPDYDDYKILQPYSCRSLSNKSKFVGGKDFITRHNPQEVSEFKKQYSREVGNLNRHRSILAPPQLSNGAQLSSSSSFAYLASQALASSPSRSSAHLDSGAEIWRQAFTATKKPCWVLTDLGVATLIGPEFRITTRVPMLPLLNPRTSTTTGPDSPMMPMIPSIRSPLRPQTPLSAFTERESARIGSGVDLLDAKQLAALARTAAYSQKSRPPSPPRSPYRSPPPEANGGAYTERPHTRTHLFDLAPPAARPATDDGTAGHHHYDHYSERPPHESRLAVLRLSPPKATSGSSESTGGGAFSPLAQQTPPHPAGVPMSPTTQPFAMEISPPQIALGTLRRGEVYLFPVRVRNVGFRQERFRVQHVSASCAGFAATIAEASYNKDAARLAPGLAAILTLTLSFQHPGKIYGRVQVATEGVGSCEVEIRGVVW
ncbi:hypothetical protein PybrP1_005328 [[Pythium] brassicae (nom. inval.)]|nr:hypothetical protein PybrP1_005328 [[Pythium] brassicae (nom. inval.)]